MEKKLAELTGKLKALSFTLGKTEDVIAKENREVTERQGTSITTMIRAVNNLKELILEQKFAEGQTDDEVAAWGEEIEDRLVEADEQVQMLNNQIRQMEVNSKAAEKAQERQSKLDFERSQYEQQEAHEELERRRQLEFEGELLKQKLEYQKALEAAHPDMQTKHVGVKLPKLVISKFNGTQDSGTSSRQQ